MTFLYRIALTVSFNLFFLEVQWWSSFIDPVLQDLQQELY
jgi:hypothetical protein